MKRTLNRYLLGVQYQGDKYNGSSHITDHLRLALQQFNGADNMDNLTLSSRTDSKVHALRNVWHVDLHQKNEVLNNVSRKKSAGGEVVLRALNHHLRKEDILISDCVQVPLTFECRRQAKYAWNVPLLDVEAMQEASKHFIGIHDFSTFRNAGCQSRSPFRHLWSVEVCVENPKASIVGLGTSDDTYSDPFMMGGYQLVTIKVSANAFVYRMVRNIVSTLVGVGTGALKPDDIPGLLAACDRNLIPAAAPAHGLFLVDVAYNNEELKLVE